MSGREYAFRWVPTLALIMSVGAPFTTPPGASGGLAGAWRVSHSCASACQGSSAVIEQVRPRGHNVYVATGGLMLYQSGNQVLVHSSAASSLLTIRVPGVLMDGVSLLANGGTRHVTWRCVAPPSGSAGAAQPRPAAGASSVVAAPSTARVRC